MGNISVAFFECNTHDSKDMGGYLSKVLQQDIYCGLIDELTLDAAKMGQKYDLVITTFHHLSGVMHTLKKYTDKVIGVDTRLTPDTLLEIARLPKGRVGVVSTLPSWKPSRLSSGKYATGRSPTTTSTTSTANRTYGANRRSRPVSSSPASSSPSMPPTTCSRQRAASGWSVSITPAAMPRNWRERPTSSAYLRSGRRCSTDAPPATLLLARPHP